MFLSHSVRIITESLNAYHCNVTLKFVLSKKSKIQTFKTLNPNKNGEACDLESH